MTFSLGKFSWCTHLSQFIPIFPFNNYISLGNFTYISRLLLQGLPYIVNVIYLLSAPSSIVLWKVKFMLDGCWLV